MERTKRPKTLEDSGYLVREHGSATANRRLSVFHRISEGTSQLATAPAPRPDFTEPKGMANTRTYFEPPTDVPKHTDQVLHFGLLTIAMVAAFM